MTNPKPRTLPPIGAALAAPASLPALGKVRAPSTATDDAAIAAAARGLGSEIGASTSLPAAPAAPRPMVRFSLELPKYLDDQLRLATIERSDTSKTSLIIQALANAGFKVEEADLAPGKRRRR